nr:hypothetical protein [Tanacetum cinerariifolium]
MWYEKKLVHLEQPLSPAPDLETGDLENIDAYYELVNAKQEAAFLMLASMLTKKWLPKKAATLAVLSIKETMGWVMHSDAIVDSCDAVLVRGVTESRVICDTVSSLENIILRDAGV